MIENDCMPMCNTSDKITRRPPTQIADDKIMELMDLVMAEQAKVRDRCLAELRVKMLNSIRSPRRKITSRSSAAADIMDQWEDVYNTMQEEFEDYKAWYEGVR